MYNKYSPIKSNLIEIRVVLILVGVYLMCEFYYAPKELSANFLTKILLIDLFALFVFTLRRETNFDLKNQILRVMPLFIIGFVIVHFQIYIDVINGSYFNFGHDYLYDKSIVCKSCVISSCALIFFLIGYTGKSSYPSSTKSLNVALLSDKYYLIFIYLLFAIFVGFTDPKYFLGGYGPAAFGGIELSGISYYANFYLCLLFIGYLAVRTYNLKYFYKIKVDGFLHYLKFLNKQILIVFVIYFVLILISGDRGPIIQLCLVLLGSFVILYKKKISLIKTILFLFFGIFIISYIAYIRELKDTNSYWDKIWEANEVMKTRKRNSSISPATVELASSVRAMHASVSYVEGNGYSYGAYQGMQIAGVIPGLGLFLSELLNLDLETFKSSTLLTQLVLGSDPTHSVGTSAVADIYLDFGLYGTIFLFLLFGLFVRHIETKVYSKEVCSIFLWVLFFLILSKSVYIGRSTIIVLFRDGIQLYILVYLISILRSRQKSISTNLS